MLTAILVTASSAVLVEIGDKEAFGRRIAAVKKKYKLSHKQFKLYSQIFDLLDEDNSGEIDIGNLRLAHQLACITLSYNGAAKLIRHIDPNSYRNANRGVKLDAFLNYFLKHNCHIGFCEDSADTQVSDLLTMQEIAGAHVVVRILQKRVAIRRERLQNEREITLRLSIQALHQMRGFLEYRDISEERSTSEEAVLLTHMRNACSLCDASRLELAAILGNDDMLSEAEIRQKTIHTQQKTTAKACMMTKLKADTSLQALQQHLKEDTQQQKQSEGEGPQPQPIDDAPPKQNPLTPTVPLRRIMQFKSTTEQNQEQGSDGGLDNRVEEETGLEKVEEGQQVQTRGQYQEEHVGGTQSLREGSENQLADWPAEMKFFV
jgi:hypothetical protein